jgi:hypothetical protein
MEMTSNRWISRGAVFCATAATMVLAGAAAQAARTSFDGAWSVIVVTDYGTCDRAYRYGLEIVNGQVFYRGDASVRINGRVTPRGQVDVRVQQGDQQATGTGRLSEDSGTGRWSGASPERQCGGHWIAERRG